MIFDAKALGKIRIGELTEERARLVEMAITGNLRYPSQAAEIEEIFREQEIAFATPSEIEKVQSAAVKDRYEHFLAGRDVRDLSDADFEKASRLLTSRATGRP